MRRANEALKDANGKALVYFKFECEKCGVTCALSRPNHLYEHGECCECGHVTEIKKAGFALIYYKDVEHAKRALLQGQPT